MRYIKFLFPLLIFFCCLGLVLPSLAQTAPSDLSNVNAAEVSDAQISQLVTQAQASGLSDAQLVQQAQSRGMSAAQIAILQKRINEARGGGNEKSMGGDTTQTQARSLNYKPDQLAKSGNKDALDVISPKIFGADLFRNNNITSTPNLNLPTPVNYIVGPNDQLNISVYGKSLVNWKLTVSPEGNINIPGVGFLNVSGKTIEQTTASIKSKLAASNYAIGQGTTVQVNLGNIRSIRVIVAGQVVKPNTYTLPSLATVFDALYACGGPNDNGSFRQIDIIRNNRVIRHLDLYDFLTKGDQKDNIGLKDQDIIQVPSYRTRVELAGEVKIPALFEVVPGETLQNVINFAGGFTDKAYTAQMKVVQISNQQYSIHDVVENDYSSHIPLRGDKYVVDKVLNRYENRVHIEGAVFRPGDFELDKGLTVSQLIQKADGLKEDAFTGRGNIIRLNPDNTTQLIAFNVLDVMNKATADIALQREDIVQITSIFDLRDSYVVNIKGEVRLPGQFAYAENMSVQDLIIKAGGFTEGASPKRIEVARRIDNADPTAKNTPVAQVFSVNVDAQLKAGDANFVLQPYDIVSVYPLPGYESQRTVNIEGEVLYPGPYTLKEKNEKISDIIKRAGGLTASADIEGGTLKRNNIAILGVDKNKKIDTADITAERDDRIKRLKKNFKDSTDIADVQVRNDYVGINLEKILKDPGSNSDLILEDGDNIRVPKMQQIVRVNGEVLYPSAVVFEKGKSFSSYVSNAGGFSPRALRRGAYVVYPNGTVKATHKFLFFNVHPSVKRGSEIYVPLKPEKKGLGASELIGLTTGIASLGAIILGILSLNK